MLISNNPEAQENEFQDLLFLTRDSLIQSLARLDSRQELEGRKFEPIVKEHMDFCAKNTPFENSIELISGQRFPDIVAKKFYGVEIKTTKQNHWKTTGNSVLESSRIDGVERIYLLFAKIFGNFEIKIKPYEDCLSEVVVTHSPRYLIDMNLKKGNTIFDKIDIPYDSLRKKENPIKEIISYYKKNLKKGESFWWMDENEIESPEQSPQFLLRIWNTLSFEEKEIYKLKGLSFFPEIFSDDPLKFSRFSLWLASSEGIICNNVRDVFSAGGQIDFQNKKVPRIFLHLLENLDKIQEILASVNKSFLSEVWKENITNENVIDIWLEKLTFFINKNQELIKKAIDIKRVLFDFFQKK